jgi:LacI family gluconate utilization system Gnt-I transcriptional repressor
MSNTSDSHTTIYDVAEHLGVSVRTVSRYFNDPDKLAGRTRERIAGAVRELGFQPNAFANRVSRRDLNVMGVLVCSDSPQGFGHTHRNLLSIASLELARHGYDLLLLVVDEQNEERVIRESFQTRKMDALLILGSPSPRLAEHLAHCPFPKLSVAPVVELDLPQHVSIGYDAEAAYRDYAARLLAQGYRRPAYVQSAYVPSRNARQLAGARAATRDTGLELCTTPATIAGAAALLDRWAAASPRPDLLLCQGDVLAACIVQVATARGLQLPADLAVAGFMGYELLDYVLPPVTTVVVPYDAMAHLAVDMVLHPDEHAPRDGRTIHLPTEYRPGTTT